MSDHNETFRSFAGSFIDSAESEENMMLFSAIAITAWNMSLGSEKEYDGKITAFERRMNRTAYTQHGRTVPLRNKILELVKRKKREFRAKSFLIVKADFVEDLDTGLSIVVTTKEPDSGDPR